jgi:hypothetical protein
MHFLKAVLIAAVLSTTAFAAQDALADGEMLGRWRLLPSSDEGPNFLELHADSGLLDNVWLDGSVDQSTGQIQLYGYVGWTDACQLTISVEGWISPDGRSLEADVGWGWRGEYGAPCYPLSKTMQGTRCGNGVVDAWEECDGSPYLEDCCSSECVFEAEGVACNVADDNVCTDDFCDGAGTCQAFNNSAACTPDGNCGTGICADGACEVLQPFEVGISCDLDDSVCTPDSCDGAGRCTAVPAIECAPCADFCDPGVGCFARPYLEQCDRDVTASLDVQTPGASKSFLKMRMRGQVAAEDLGDPTTRTSYTLCLFRDYSSFAIAIGRIEIPADDQCSGVDCWKSFSKGFSYRKRDESGEGVLTARMTRGGLRMKAGGTAVTLPDFLPGPFVPGHVDYLAKLVAEDGASQTCWSQTLAPAIDTAERFKGRGFPSVP